MLTADSGGPRRDGVSIPGPVVRREGARCGPHPRPRRPERMDMTRYLISFNYGDMVVAAADLPAVSEAAHAVVREAQAAGVLVFAGGVLEPQATTRVARDGTAAAADASRREFIAGLTIVDVASREEALRWAAKIAASCRCAQEVREFMDGSAP